MKLIYLFIFIGSISFAQESDPNQKAHLNIELSQDFGNIFAVDTIRIASGGSFNLASPTAQLSVTLPFPGNGTIEPYIYGCLKTATFTAKNNLLDRQIDNGTNYTVYDYSQKSIGSTDYFGAGVRIMKRVGNYFSIGGGFALNYRRSLFLDLGSIYHKEYNDQSTNANNDEGIGFLNAETITKLNWSVPVYTRTYIPIGKNWLTANVGFQIAKVSWFSAGIGITF